MKKSFSIADFKTNGATRSFKTENEMINDMQSMCIIGIVGEKNSFSVWIDEYSNGHVQDSFQYFDDLTIEDAIIQANKMIF